MLIGAFIGGAIGFAAPIGLYHILDADQITGSGTIFSLMWLFTIPLGVALGTIIAAVFGGALRE
jgi:hypothetical protein